MNKKFFTLSMFLMLFAFVTNGNAEEKVIEVYGGETDFGNDPGYGKWFYFSFENGEVMGESAFVIEDANAANIGTEIPNVEWAARNDWDIAFHSTDIRTNGLEAVLIADTTSEKPLAEVYAELTEAPAEGFEADEMLTGTFIASMASMPPLRATQISGCKATHGWASYGMRGTVVNSMVVVFKLSGEKYVKAYFKEFLSEEGKPGYIKLEYAVLGDDGSSNENIEGVKVSVYPNPATEAISVVMPDSQENTPIGVYSISGALVKQVNASAGVNTISVSELPAGMYVVKTNSTAHKVIVR